MGIKKAQTDPNKINDCDPENVGIQTHSLRQYPGANSRTIDLNAETPFGFKRICNGPIGRKD